MPIERLRQLRIELPCTQPIRRALPDLELNQELAGNLTAPLEDGLAVDADVQVLELARGVPDLLEARDALFHEVLENAEAGLHMRLAVFLLLGVVVLEGTQAGAGHEEEGDVLHVFGNLGVGVL